MDKKILSYEIEELIEDSNFISFVEKKEDVEKWETFIKGNPGFEKKARTARNIILLLKDSHDIITEDNISSIWHKIDQFYGEQLLHQKRVIRFRNFLRYAAIIAIIITIAGIGYFNLKDNNSYFQFAKSESEIVGGNSRLVLSNGQEIDLKKKESIIQINGIDKLISINSDIVVSLPKSDKNQIAKGYNEVVVPYGKKSIIVLEDGTKVWLNSGSRFAFPSHFTSNKREVFMKGEAYFVVTHNEAKPFFVNINELTFKVLGTSFNISAYDMDKDIQTMLVEGKLAISGYSALNVKGKETIMAPNQLAVFNKEGKSLIVKDEPNVEFYTAWVKGSFSFSKENLLVVFNKLERYYNIKFIYDNGFPTDDLISGKLDLKDSIKDVLVTLSDLAKISYKIENENIYINKKQK
jgi:transmembrane sensor